MSVEINILKEELKAAENALQQNANSYNQAQLNIQELSGYIKAYKKIIKSIEDESSVQPVDGENG
jgi:proline dehydrogenase